MHIRVPNDIEATFSAEIRKKLFRGNLIIYPILVSALSLRAEIQFAGYFSTASESVFTLVDKDSNESSTWLKMGDSFHSYTVSGFDRESEVITLEKDGNALHLRLRESKVRDGRMTVEGTMTTWPDKGIQSFHASFYLGEEQTFPLGKGRILHVTASRLADGTIRYQPSVVIRESDGKETSESWPFVVTAPGGEFSLRVGDIGFSFKP